MSNCLGTVLWRHITPQRYISLWTISEKIYFVFRLFKIIIFDGKFDFLQKTIFVKFPIPPSSRVIFRIWRVYRVLKTARLNLLAFCDSSLNAKQTYIIPLTQLLFLPTLYSPIGIYSIAYKANK